MGRHARFFRGSVCLMVLALALLPGAARSAVIVINNGLAPPYPDNVIDDETYGNDEVVVQNVGCNLLVEYPCSSPGAPTQVELVDGGAVNSYQAYDSSSITMSGGTVEFLLLAFDSGTVTMSGGSAGWLEADLFGTATMSGGTVANNLQAFDSGVLTMSGGTVAGSLYAEDLAMVTVDGGVVEGSLEVYESAVLTILVSPGSPFYVNGDSVPYGDISALSGTLSGQLASGEYINNAFDRASGAYPGTITVVPIPEPATALLVALGLVGLAAGRR